MRTSLQLYRDVMRLVDHVAGKSRKAEAMKVLVRKEFRKNADEIDPDKITQMKQRAQKGIQNYLALEAVSKLKPKDGVSGAQTPVFSDSPAAAAAQAAAQKAAEASGSVYRPNLSRVRID